MQPPTSLPAIALGAMNFGTLTEERLAFDILDCFVAGGGVSIDTANCYAFWSSPTGHGSQSEEVIGRWLARRPGMAERVVLSTKVGAEPTIVGNWPGSAEGLSRDVIRSSVEANLARLGVDRIEFFWAHMDDRSTPQSESVEAFADLVESGKVGRVGASNFALWRLERARALAAAADRPGFTAVQLRHSYISPRPHVAVADAVHRFGFLTDETLDYVDNHADMSIWAYTPLLRGSFDRPDRPFAQAYQHFGTDERLSVLGEVAAEVGATRGQVVLAWLTGGSPAVTPIVGASCTMQIDEALAGGRLTLTAEQRGRLDVGGSSARPPND